uniref:Ionotropic glutamate receptor C-terminal domain-containing protein n=1 Tax=Graphocephala atropunctata TaxID=36148 RepID=A0A1B6KUX8_9HEMI
MIAKTKLTLLVRRPEQMDFQWKVFKTIFQSEVWVATITAFVTVLAAHHALNFHSSGWLEGFLAVLGHFLMTNSQHREKDRRAHFVLTSWSVFSLLLTSCLSSGIVSRLTLPLFSPRVDTFQQLVEQNYYWIDAEFARANQVENEKIFSEFETGLLKHWEDEVMRRWPEYDTKHLTVEKDVQAFSEPQPLHLNKARPVFYLLVFGLGLSLLVFVIEVLW